MPDSPPTAEPNECDCCGFENPVGGLKEYTDGMPKQSRWFCQICAGTHVGNRAMWPQNYTSDPLRRLPQDIAWMANRIRKDLESRHD